MRLTDDERKLLIRLVKEHQKSVRHLESFANQDPIWFRAEVKYDEFIEKLLKKLKS
jgi:hypothetical protein